jgi:hypothetical protein
VVCALPVVPPYPFGTTELSPTKIDMPEGPKGLPDELSLRTSSPPLRVIGAADAKPTGVPAATRLASNNVLKLLTYILPKVRAMCHGFYFDCRKNTIVSPAEK